MASDNGGSAVAPWHLGLATLMEVAWPGLVCWAIIGFVIVLDSLHGMGALIAMAAAYLFLVVGPFWTFIVTTWKVSRRAKIVSAVVNLSPAAVLGLLTL